MTTEIITLLLRLAIAVMVGIVVPAFTKWLDAKTENEQLAKVKEVAKTAVYAAEQIYKGVDPDGEIRRKYAREAIVRVAKSTGMALTEREIDEIIQAAVKELNFFNITSEETE